MVAWEESPMSPFEFVTVLLSIVVGLGITRLLGGLARAIEIRGTIKHYWVQIVWCINVGLYLVIFWWVVVFSYAPLERFLFVNFLTLFLYAVLLYLQAALILPGNLEPGTDLGAHFFTIRPWFFFLGAIIPLLELTDSLMHGVQNLLNLGWIYIVIQVSAIPLSLIAMRTTNRIYHETWCIMYLCTMASWAVFGWWSIG
jgi:hypothetical protein